MEQGAGQRRVAAQLQYFSQTGTNYRYLLLCPSQICKAWVTVTLFLLAHHILKPFLHIDTEYLSQNLVKITYCAAQQSDFLKLNVLGYFIFSSTYQKQLSSNYGIQSLPVSILDTYVSVFISSKTSQRIKSLDLIFSLRVKNSPASFLKSSARKSVS